QGVGALQGPLATLISQELGQQLPVVQQSLSNALGLTADIQSPFRTTLSTPSLPDPSAAINAIASQLQAAGFSVQYLNTTPEAGSNDLLRVVFTHQWAPSASFGIS